MKRPESIFIEKTLVPCVLHIRESLTMEYDIVSEYRDFSGLCDVAVGKLEEILKEEFADAIEVTYMHGEQKHTPRLGVYNWVYQHTWAKVRLKGLKHDIYVDPTSGQFSKFYDDIPDFYVSVKPPKWYYSDRKNPVYQGITRTINQKIRVKQKWRTDGATLGVIEHFQYMVWGQLSDILHVLIYERDRIWAKR